MNILEFFQESHGGDINQYILNDEEREAFLNSLPKEFQLCYISEKKLQELAARNKVTAREFFNQFCIPETPSAAHIRSGDFGEMLCFFLIKDIGEKNGLRLVGPRKWRWKENRNHPCHGSDGVLFHRANKVPSAADGVEVVESKMKAVPKKNGHPIDTAIKGARDDKVKRLAKTLNWFNDKLAAEGKPQLRNALERYRFPDTHGTYQKKFHAIAIIDSTLIEVELSKEHIEAGPDIQVSVIVMDRLKEVYENTYESMLEKL